MKHLNLRGKRYANWARRSDVTQDQSISDQLEVTNAFAEQHEMLHVCDYKFEGTGSIPGARDDIEEVLKDAAAKNVEVLLLHDISRLTRSGIEHGMKVLYDIKSEGMEAVFVRDDVPGGEWAGVFQTLLLFAANQYSRKLADASTRSSQMALEQGRITTCKLTPYGLDRLVLSLDDEPRFRVRNLVNGDQVRLHPTDDTEVLETFHRDENGKRGFYSKQKNEKVVLVPGEKATADTVRWMFQRYFVEGASFNGIRKDLNRRGIPSPRGLRWSKRSVSQILRNPIYTGRGLANSYTESIYMMRSPGEPKASRVEFKTLAKNKRPPRLRRPESDWVWREEPHLKDFLPAAVKLVAEEYHRKHLDRIKNGHRPKPGGNRHADSSFVLSKILHNTEGKALVGHPNNGRRAYAPKYKEGEKRRLVPAGPLERAVLDAVRDAVTVDPELRSRVRQFVEQEVAAVADMRVNIDGIRFRQKQLLSKIAFMMDRVATTVEVKELTEHKIREAESELADVNRELKKAEGEVPAALHDVDGAVDAVIKRVHDLGNDLADQSVTSLHRLLGIVIEKLVIDPHTFEVDLSVKLPATAVWTAYEQRGDRCPIPTSDPNCTNWTEQPGVPLATFRCISNGFRQYDRVCWSCSRSRGGHQARAAA